MEIEKRCKVLVLGLSILVAVWLPARPCFSVPELPVLVKTAGAAKGLFLIDDSGSMNAVIMHSNFSWNDPVATNPANDIPAVIWRLQSGTSAPTTSQTLTPVLVEVNIGFNTSSTTSDFWVGRTFNSPSSFPLVSTMNCNNTSGSAVCCPGTSGSGCPKTGVDAASLFSNSAITGTSIFSTANLAQSGGSNVVDSNGNEYLYMAYRRNDYERLTDNWNDVWSNLDSAGVNQPRHTHVYSTNGGTVVFNGKEVFLSAGWYPIEYLRWIFYAATSAELAALPGVNRLQSVKDVVTQIINNNPTVSFGLATINGTTFSSGVHSGNQYNQWYSQAGNASSGADGIIRDGVGTSTASLISSLNSIAPFGGTAVTNAYIEVLRYFGGAADNDSFTSSTASYTSPITSQCDAHFIVVMTDGLPSGETNKRLPNGNWVTNFDGQSDGASSNQNCQNTSSDLCAAFFDDAAWFAYHYDLRTSVPGIQNVTTYTVGLNLDYSLLQNVAADGGSGSSYLVTNSTELASTLQDIVNVVLETPTAGAGVATLDKFFGDQLVYAPDFYGDTWKGDINVFTYDNNSQALTFSYNMADILRDRDISSDPRNIIAGLDTDHDGNTNQSIAFTTSNAATLKPELFYQFSTNAESSTLLEAPLQSYSLDSTAQTLISFISGAAVAGLRTRDRDNSGKVDRLGDIVYSRPVEVGPKNGNYSYLDGYTAYTSSRLSQPRILLVGSNDGMLHAFNSESGAELWTYIPSSQLRHLEKLSRLKYNTTYRRSYVDGQINVEDVYVGGAWKTYAMFGLRTGGTQYVVLDITDRSNPVLVWEVDAASNGGQSWTKPAVVINSISSTATSPASFSWYMVVGTGEGKTSAGTNLLIYSLSSSTPPTPTVKSVSSSDPAGTRTTSIVTLQNDADYAVDRMYFGTELGDLYRVKVLSGSPSTWVVERVYDGPSTQPIVATPLAVLTHNPQYSGAASGAASMPLAVGVYFGTGKYDDRPDIATYATISQVIAGVFDPVDTSSDGYANVLLNQTTSNFQNQSVGSTTIVRKSGTGEYLVPANKSGFYINLATSINVTTSGYIDPVGRVVQPPINIRGLIAFTTFLPDTGSCDIGGSGFLQGVGFQTGGGLAIDQYNDPDQAFYNGGIPDINGDTAFNSSDLSLGFSNNQILPVLDTHVESIDLTEINPYEHDGELLENDLRLHASNGAFVASVSSIGHNGLPSSPTFLGSAAQLIVQPAYPADPPSSGGGSGGGSGGTGIGSGSQMPPPTNMPVNLYSLMMDVLSFVQPTNQ